MAGTARSVHRREDHMMPENSKKERQPTVISTVVNGEDNIK